jgi:signal transduction histidine kinase
MPELTMHTPLAVCRPGMHTRRGHLPLLPPLGVAIVATLGALLTARALEAVVPSPTFLPFVAAVAVAARYRGRAAGILSCVLSVVAIDYVFIRPAGGAAFGRPAQLVHTAVFLLVALIVGETTEALRAARREAEGRAAELTRRNEELAAMNVELEAQMEEVRALTEELQSANDSLLESRDDAEAAARAREEVLAVVAHDLRNPLQTVGMTAHLLLEIELPPEQRARLVGAMARAVTQMNRLVDDLLDAVRIESGQLSLEPALTSARALLEQVEETFRAAAAERRVRLEFESPPAGLSVRADAGRVLQVLGNLVGNALKFSAPAGRVLVRAAPAEGEWRVVFEVKDTGPGIAPEDLARLFDRFWQKRRADRRGVGLGLTIAKGIVEAHGGRIWAESRVGQGSTFAFALPADVRAALPNELTA